MSAYPSSPIRRKRRTLPFVVVLAALYQLAKAGFLLYVFWQCWLAKDTEIPPFGDVRNPLFKAPDFYAFPLLAAVLFVLALGLICLGRWARVCVTLLFLAALGLWLLNLRAGQGSLLFPLEPATMLSAFAADALAIGLLYGTAQARNAFAPEKRTPSL
jgi:hypothetical protein